VPLIAATLGDASAASTGTLPYRGELAESGVKLSGKRAMRFTVKTHPTTGQVVFEQTVADVELMAGRFAVELGACPSTSTNTTCTNGVSTTPITGSNALAAVLATRPAALYVQVAIANQGAVSGATFTPMNAWQRITSAPYAIEAPKAILGRWRTELTSCAGVGSDSASALAQGIPALDRDAVLVVRHRVRHNGNALASRVAVSTTVGTVVSVRHQRVFSKQNGDDPTSSGYWTLEGSSSFDVSAATPLTVRVSVQDLSNSTTAQACSSSLEPSFVEVTAYAK
jgi:hypothetical protein